MNNINSLKQLLTPWDVGHKKIRIGPNEDGGYVLSEDCLAKTTAVYSLGVGPECRFDLELANRGHRIYQYESAHPRPLVDHKNFIYKNLFITGETFVEELTANSHPDKNLLLSMDIESGEYNLIGDTPSIVLGQFNQIVLELHDVLHNKNVEQLLHKLNERFVLIHLHANNYCNLPGAYSGGMFDGLPNVLELTYVNRREIKSVPVVSKQQCPDPVLDHRNYTGLPDILMNWWIG
jgi:hypothetical protein